MKVSAIVPQKALAASKSRLAPTVDRSARIELALGLLQHVCTVLRALPEVETLVVMTPDPEVRVRVSPWGVPAVPDPAPDLNASLAHVMAATARHAHGILILAADLPMLQPADVLALLLHGTPRVLGMAPSKDGTGTNALLIPPGIRFRPAYGTGSRAAHRREAASWGLAVVEVVRPGLAFDLDTPADAATVLLPEGT